MTFSRTARLVGVAVMVMLANVTASVLYMVVYSYVIDPGHEPKYYNDHIQIAAPYCSIAAGIPLMFLAGWWVAGWWQRKPGIKAALLVWLAYTVIDLAVLLAVGVTLTLAIPFVVSVASKLSAAYFGARMRVRDPTEAVGL
jgi:hypothetical protein